MVYSTMMTQSAIKKNDICRKMDGTEDHNFKKNNPDSERQISHFLLHAKSRLKYISCYIYLNI